MIYCCELIFNLPEHVLCKSAAHLALQAFRDIYPSFFPNIEDVIIKHIPGENGVLDIMVSMPLDVTFEFSALVIQKDIPEIKMLPTEILQF